MISIEDAEKILKSFKIKPVPEKIPVLESLNRILAHDIVSEINMPPFDKSAMDGYAVSSADCSESLRIVETIFAGSIPDKTISRGECSKIMTGAMLPRGADKVIKKEIVEEKDGYAFVVGNDKNINICLKGEDIKAGDTVLRSGIRIGAPEVGIIASMGLNSVEVYKKPLIGLLTTGSEIVEPGKKLKDGQIYNSNAFSISAQLLQIGLNIKYGGIVSDEKPELKKQISSIISETDVVIISGGVSVGDYDFVPDALAELGVDLHIRKVAVKPGKPTLFGTKGKKIFFGLPGNPVSTFVILEIFIKPFLYRMMGHDYSPLRISGILNSDIKIRDSSRSSFIPVSYMDGFVEKIEYHGSAHLNALAAANGILQVPAGVREILKGSAVNVRQI